MWTDEARTAELIFRVVKDGVAQRLLYQSQMHLENFRHASKQLKESFETLLFHNFARTQVCHMADGIFGADIHTAEMESAKIRVWGFLLNTATAGHKLFRCITNARKQERQSDWIVLRDDLKSHADTFRRARNFLEHLDEMTDQKKVSGIEDCKFSRHGVLVFTDSKGRIEFDFTETGLSPVEAIWSKVIALLKARKEEASS